MQTNRFSWRVIDIVTASILGVTAGVIFWVWGLTWGAVSAPFEALTPGLGAFPAALWLFAGVLGGLIIRKPGAALYTELLAASVSAFIGSQWGPLTLVSGLVQGIGAELIFALFLYRGFNWAVALLAGAAAGLAMAINDLVLWYVGAAPLFATVYIVAGIAGGAIIAGGGAYLLTRALARAGALRQFAVGQAA